MNSLFPWTRLLFSVIQMAWEKGGIVGTVKAILFFLLFPPVFGVALLTDILWLIVFMISALFSIGQKR